MKDTYREHEPTRCATCDAPIERGLSFLSSRGPVCDACHRADVRLEKERSGEREAGVEILFAGVVSVFAGAYLAVMGLFADLLAPKLCLICGAELVAAFVYAFRVPSRTSSVLFGKGLVALGAITGAGGFLAIVMRFYG